MMELYCDCCFAGGLRIAVMLSYLSLKSYWRGLEIEKRCSHNLKSGPLTMWPAEF